MNDRALYPTQDPGHQDYHRISDLLVRYPNVSDDEADQILAFLKGGRYFDVGLLTSNSRLNPSLDAFLKDHRSHFQVEPGRAEAVLGVVILFLFILWGIWAALN